MTSQLELFAFSDLNVTPGQSDTIHRDGFTLRAIVYADDNTGTPWEREDGHGPVSDWRANAMPGERALSTDRHASRFYDFDEAVKIAKRDAWGVEGGRDEGESLDDYAHRAALSDFNRLKAWCDDQWQYVGVAVTVSREGVILSGKYEHATWGTESDCPAHLSTLANDLIDEALEAARAKVQALTLEGVRPLLQRAEAFVSGFEDDDTQEGVPALLADLRAVIGEA